MSIQITTLSDNEAAPGFRPEFGLSLHIDVNGFKLLLDTGLNDSAVHNAKLLGVDLSALDAIVLSHGHYDHTGGLESVLKVSGPKKIIAHPDIWDTKYSSRGGLLRRDVGIPFAREELENLGASFSLHRTPVEVSPGIVTSGEVPMTTDFEFIDEGLFSGISDDVVPDQLLDDLSLAIKTQSGLVVVFGCAHRGPVNIIRHLQKVTGEKRIRALVGGTHLVHATDERIENTVQYFKQIGIEQLACSHCTGPRASSRMVEVYGDGFIQNNAGVRLKFE